MQHENQPQRQSEQRGRQEEFRILAQKFVFSKPEHAVTIARQSTARGEKASYLPSSRKCFLARPV
jgi:hypothetical protein